METETVGLLERFVKRMSLEDILTALITLLVCIVVTRLILKLMGRLLQKTRLEQRVRRYVVLVAKTIMYILTAVFTIGSLGIDMSSLVALLSVGSLGVTLAAEDVLGNVAGGLVILSSHPFALGDFIESGGVTGTVDEINLIHTKLITPDGPIALLPNKELAASKVTNYTVLGRRRMCWKLTASYSAPTETIRAACFQALEMTKDILEDPAPIVFLSSFGESGVEFTVYCWTLINDYWPVYFSLGEYLRYAFKENGIEIPYNKLDVHIMDGKERRSY